MTDYTQATGNSSVMKISDDGVEYVDFWLLGVNQVVDQIPWSYTADGITSSWRSFRLEANVAWQKVATIRIVNAQTVTFTLGDSGNVKVGGPVDFAVDIPRTAVAVEGVGVVRVKVGDIFVQAVPYVNDNGEWKQAQPWGRLLGEWNPAR